MRPFRRWRHESDPGEQSQRDTARSGTATWLRLPAIVSLAAAAALLASGGATASSTGTSVTASLTATGHLTSTFNWTIEKTGNPSSQTVAIGNNASVQWTITTTASPTGTLGAYLDGQVCVTNAGSAPTQNLAITDRVTKPPSTTVLSAVTVDLSAKPSIPAGGSWCYPYKITIPTGAIVAGATYKDTANVTITNLSSHLGTPAGPSPSTTTALPTTPTAVDSSITVNDTNGQTFAFSSSGSQSYTQTIPCSKAGTISPTNTATIAGTGQSSTATVTVNCDTPTTTTTILSASSLRTGGSVTDQASITGLPTSYGGTITYKIYTTSDCSGAAYADATPSSNTLGSGGFVFPASKSITFNTAGTYYWQAVYSGDPTTNTLGSASACGSEKLTVISCTVGTSGCPWNSGDLTTYNPTGWQITPSPTTLTNDFTTVYSTGSAKIGGTYAMFFDSANAVLRYFFNEGGSPGPLTETLIDPTSSSSGLFGADVLALQLDVDFADAGDLTANSGFKFGDLTVCGLTTATDLNGQTVRQVLAVINTALGGGTTTDPISDLAPLTRDLNASFHPNYYPSPSAWAQAHLVNGACP